MLWIFATVHWQLEITVFAGCSALAVSGPVFGITEGLVCTAEATSRDQATTSSYLPWRGSQGG